MATCTVVNICTVHSILNECHENVQIVISKISQHGYTCMENIQWLHWFVF